MSYLSSYPKVSVIIVTYNGKNFLEKCIKSVLKTSYPNFEIIVVDNGSEDTTSHFLKEVSQSEPNIKFILNSKNKGPSFARNQGIKIAQGELIAFLDNDTEVSPNWLNEAFRIFKEDSKIGACQCKLLLSNSDNLIDCVGEYMSRWGFLVQLADFGYEKDEGQYDEIKEILAAKSAGMICRKDVLLDIGGFDPDYFIYVEETDLCWRIWLKGYKVVLAPKSVIYHTSGTTNLIAPNKVNYLVKFHGVKNYISTLIKNLEAINLIKILPVHIFLWLGVAGYFLTKGRLRSSLYILRGISWNFIHLGRVIKKHRVIQSNRIINDRNLFPKVIRNKNLGYFIAKLKDTRKIGHDIGWDKGE